MTTEEKIEEFRSWLAQYSTDLRLANGKFNALFHPPKPKGCWGFWMDNTPIPDPPRVFNNGFQGKEAASKGRAELARFNPGPVFFLEEK